MKLAACPDPSACCWGQLCSCSAAFMLSLLLTNLGCAGPSSTSLCRHSTFGSDAARKLAHAARALMPPSWCGLKQNRRRATWTPHGVMDTVRGGACGGVGKGDGRERCLPGRATKAERWITCERTRTAPRMQTSYFGLWECCCDKGVCRGGDSCRSNRVIT